MRDFRNLQIWPRSHQLVLEVYKKTANFPKSGRFGLVSQIRRSAASVPANIAEGCDRSEGDLSRFLQIAIGSGCELEYHLILAPDLDQLRKDHAVRLLAKLSEIKRMITTFRIKQRTIN